MSNHNSVLMADAMKLAAAWRQEAARIVEDSQRIEDAAERRMVILQAATYRRCADGLGKLLDDYARYRLENSQ